MKIERKTRRDGEEGKMKENERTDKKREREKMKD